MVKNRCEISIRYGGPLRWLFRNVHGSHREVARPDGPSSRARALAGTRGHHVRTHNRIHTVPPPAATVCAFVVAFSLPPTFDIRFVSSSGSGSSSRFVPVSVRLYVLGCCGLVEHQLSCLWGTFRVHLGYIWGTFGVHLGYIWVNLDWLATEPTRKASLDWLRAQP
jgi:hypothetical protein